MTAFPEPEFIDLSSVRMAVYRAGPALDVASKPPVVFLHGFPELAYSWRYQMQALADAGYPVFAPDQRGYGATDKPEGVENYTMAKLTGDLGELLDHYGLEKAIFVGHDWGAIILWTLPFYLKGRVLGCAGMNVAHIGHYPADPLLIFRNHFGPDMYIVQFQEEGRCEPQLERDVEATFRFFFRKPVARLERLPGGGGKEGESRADKLDFLALLDMGEENWPGALILSDDDLKFYVDAFEKGGFTGPLHWYRNMSGNWRDMEQFLVDGQLPAIEEPVLMITADLDRACPPTLAEGMDTRCSDYTRVDLKGCGHWVQSEQTEEVNQALLSWLYDNF